MTVIKHQIGRNMISPSTISSPVAAPNYGQECQTYCMNTILPNIMIQWNEGDKDDTYYTYSLTCFVFSGRYRMRAQDEICFHEGDHYVLCYVRIPYGPLDKMTFNDAFILLSSIAVDKPTYIDSFILLSSIMVDVPANTPDPVLRLQKHIRAHLPVNYYEMRPEQSVEDYVDMLRNLVTVFFRIYYRSMSRIICTLHEKGYPRPLLW